MFRLAVFTLEHVVRAHTVIMVKVHVLVFWGMELYSLVGGYWHFCRCTFRLQNLRYPVFICGCWYMVAHSGQNAETNAKLMCKQRSQ